MRMTSQSQIDALFSRCKNADRKERSREGAIEPRKRRRTCVYLGACEKHPGEAAPTPPPHDRLERLLVEGPSDLDRAEYDFSKTATAAFAACALLPLWWENIHGPPCPIAHPFIFIRDAHPDLETILISAWGEEYRDLEFEGSSVPVCGVHNRARDRIERVSLGSRALRRDAPTVIFLYGTERASDFVPKSWRYLEVSLAREREIVQEFLDGRRVECVLHAIARVRKEHEERRKHAGVDVLFDVILKAVATPIDVLTTHEGPADLEACRIDIHKKNDHDWDV